MVLRNLFGARRAFFDGEFCGMAIVCFCAVAVVWIWVDGRRAKHLGSSDQCAALLSLGEDDGESAPDDALKSRYKEPLVNSLGMRFVLIPPGEFQMGSPQSEEFRKKNELQHRVRITQPFYLGIHEVTVAQFRRFVEETGHRTDSEEAPQNERALEVTGKAYVWRSELTWRRPGFPQEDDHPVVYVSWHDAMAFCRWLSSKEDRQYRLPTEAEWEYACRAGTSTRFSCGDSSDELFEVANVQHWVLNKRGGIDRQKQPHRFTTPVAAFGASPLGLYDMHGNVWEWCSDWHHQEYYAHSETNDPRGASEGDGRVVRGGSFRFAQWAARSANRAAHLPTFSLPDVGFRVAMTCKEQR